MFLSISHPPNFPCQDPFWSFATKSWADQRIAEDDFRAKALLAAEDYMARLRAADEIVLSSEVGVRQLAVPC